MTQFSPLGASLNVDSRLIQSVSIIMELSTTPK